MTDPYDDHTSRLGMMIVVSGVLHLAVILGGGSWQIYSPPRLTFGPVYEVKLVDSLPSSAPMYNVAPEGPVAKRAELSVKREEAPLPITRLRPPVERAETVKKALEEIKKRVAQTEGVTAAPSSSRTGKIDDGVMNTYLRMIWERIRGEWVLPPGIAATDRWEAVVHVKVLKNGRLSDVKLERSSGNTYFDRSVLRAIQKADPLPPFPPEMHDESIEIGIRFHSQEAMR